MSCEKNEIDIVSGEEGSEKRQSIIPGFRSGKLYKKIIAVILYCFMAITILGLIIGTPLISDASLQTTLIHYISIFAQIVLFVLVPFVLVTDFLGWRSKLPLFKLRKISTTIFASFLCVVVWSFASGMITESLC